MKTNSKLQKDVQNAIKWEPAMLAAEIGVTAKDGVINLSGTVNRYSKKINAENAAKRVKGVKAVVEDIKIDYGKSFKKNDTHIAIKSLDALKNNWEVPKDRIQVNVENGWVKLEGNVPWKFQEEASEYAVKNLEGVIGVSNLITVKSESKDSIEKADVINALKRNWAINSKDIKVDIELNSVKLTGLVHSLYQKDEAGRLAWNAPGVHSVENNLAVIY